MPYLLKGALIEYGVGLIGPIPNVVIFQFNPENLTRTMKIPPRPTGAASRENTQAGEKPLESISFRAQFSAADEINDKKVLAQKFGIGPRLCALEKMVHPTSKDDSLLGAAVDAIAGALGSGKKSPTQAIPREQYPKLIFIWGITRVLPVVIESMRIAELEYDPWLNPVRADVDIELTVNALDSCSDDKFAQGALKYSNMAKEVQAAANLVNTAEQIVELIPL